MPIAIDLEELIIALENQPEFGDFFLDKQSGKIIGISDLTDDDADTKRQHLEDDPARFLYIEPIESRIGWGIMEDFMASIEDHEVRQALERALNGRKPFRSFKDELLAFPETRQQWFNYHAQRMNEIAKDWLSENDISFGEQAKSAGTARHL